MRVKNIVLAIKSEEEFTKEVKDVMKNISRDVKSEPESIISYESLEVMRKFITDERLRILKTIKKEHPSSIYALAKTLKRDTKNVSNDVNYLAELGLIELRKIKEGRKKTIPTVNYDKILLEIAV